MFKIMCHQVGPLTAKGWTHSGRGDRGAIPPVGRSSWDGRTGSEAQEERNLPIGPGGERSPGVSEKPRFDLKKQTVTTWHLIQRFS